MAKTKKKKKGCPPPHPYRAFVQWCVDECERIAKNLDLTSVVVKMELEPTENVEWSFEVHPGYPYQHALIKWRTDQFQLWKKDRKRISKVLLHEMIHVLLAPVMHVAGERWATTEVLHMAGEELTDKLTQILWKK